MILVGAATAAEREVPFHLAQVADPTLPVTGHAFVLGEVKVTAPGASEVSVAVDHIVEKGHGDYAAVLTPAQVLVAGKIYVYALVTGARPYTGNDDIVSLGVSALMANVMDAAAPIGAQTFAEQWRLVVAYAVGNVAGLDGPVGSHTSLDGLKHRLEWLVQNGKRTLTKRDGAP